MNGRRLLVLANGHGEDAIAGRILDRLPPLAVSAWAIVGRGDAYRNRGLPAVGVPNHLPSDGFATLSLKSMRRDLRAGWVGVHLAQDRCAVSMRGTYDLALAVGDIVPLWLAHRAGLPTLFVPSAKSIRYGWRYRFRLIETRLMRKALRVFPRDEPTTEWLTRRGVPAEYVGNPMMDDLDPEGPLPRIGEGTVVIGALPGSRAHQADNLVSLLATADALAASLPPSTSTAVLCAATPAADIVPLLNTLASQAATGTWRVAASPASSCPASPGPVLSAEHRTGLRYEVWTNRFAAILHRADVVIGLAGTANEQAIGLGRPLVTYPAAGPFDWSYVRMKMQYLGQSAIAVPADPVSVAAAIRGLLDSPSRRASMAATGRALMGSSGASQVIADAVRDALAGRERKRT